MRFAVDAVEEELLTREEALLTIDAESLDALLHPTFDPEAEFEVLARGVAASPGAAVGEIVFRAAEAVAAAEEGRDVILVRPFTEADDVAGFQAAKGVLTSEGGKASHAALVARGMGVPAVTGAGLEIDLDGGEVRMGETTLKAGDRIAIDGTSGTITNDDVPLVEPEVGDAFDTVLEWADELKTMEVRANADTPEDAQALARVRRDRHRPVPHRAHVLRATTATRRWSRSSSARRPRSAASASRRCCRSSRATSRACSRRWRACRSRSGCSTRRCTSSCRRARRSSPRSSARGSR